MSEAAAFGVRKPLAHPSITLVADDGGAVGYLCSRCKTQWSARYVIEIGLGAISFWICRPCCRDLSQFGAE